MCKKIKTNEDRLERMQELCQLYIGPIQKVSLELRDSLWICKLKMEPEQYFNEIVSIDKDPSKACKATKKKLKKVIARYNIV